MSKNKIKLIMELIFIFILPLIFICFTSEIQIERNFEYDNNGNYETSSDIKKISFDNSIIKYTNSPLYINYLDYNQLYNNEYTNNSRTFNDITVEKIDYGIKINGTFTGTSTEYNFYTSTISLNPLHKYLIYSFNNNSNIVLNGTTTTYSNTPIFINNINSIRFYRQITVGETFNDYIIQNNIFDLTQMFGSGYEPTTIQEFNNYINLDNKHIYTESEIIKYESDNIIAENNTINYTIWGNVKNLLINNLDLNDNVLIDIILCYMILWIINWIIWHLFYGFLELLIHIIPRKWERE